MEKRITKKVHQHFIIFKESIINKLKKLNQESKIDEIEYKNLLGYLYDYQSLTICKEDLTKRKRVKNSVPLHERCCALRANGEQCTRRKKDGNEYCGTHVKGRPHGEVNDKKQGPTMKKVEVWAEDINGIIYYIDNFNNVYDHNDIINGIPDPKVIAKYEKTIEGVYSIPSIFSE